MNKKFSKLADDKHNAVRDDTEIDALMDILDQMQDDILQTSSQNSDFSLNRKAKFQAKQFQYFTGSKQPKNAFGENNELSPQTEPKNFDWHDDHSDNTPVKDSSDISSNLARDVLMDKNRDSKQKLLKVIEISKFIYEKYEMIASQNDALRHQQVNEEHGEDHTTSEMIALAEQIEARDNQILTYIEECSKKDQMIITLKSKVQSSSNLVLCLQERLNEKEDMMAKSMQQLYLKDRDDAIPETASIDLKLQVSEKQEKQKMKEREQEQKLKQYEGLVEDLYLKIRGLQEELSDAIDTVEKQKNQISQQEEMIQENLYEIQQLNDEMDQYENKIQELNDENKTIIAENVSQQQRIKSIMKDLTTSRISNEYNSILENMPDKDDEYVQNMAQDLGLQFDSLQVPDGDEEDHASPYKDQLSDFNDQESYQSNATPKKFTDEVYTVDDSHQNNMQEMQNEMQEIHQEFKDLGIPSEQSTSRAGKSVRFPNLVVESEPRVEEGDNEIEKAKNLITPRQEKSNFVTFMEKIEEENLFEKSNIQEKKKPSGPPSEHSGHQIYENSFQRSPINKKEDDIGGRIKEFALKNPNFDGLTPPKNSIHNPDFNLNGPKQKLSLLRTPQLKNQELDEGKSDESFKIRHFFSMFSGQKSENQQEKLLSNHEAQSLYKTQLEYLLRYFEHEHLSVLKSQGSSMSQQFHYEVQVNNTQQEYEFFKFTALSIILNQPYFFIQQIMDTFLRSINNSIYSMYIQAKQKNLQFHQFSEWVDAKVTDCIYDRSKSYGRDEIIYANTLNKQMQFQKRKSRRNLQLKPIKFEKMDSQNNSKFENSMINNSVLTKSSILKSSNTGNTSFQKSKKGVGLKGLKTAQSLREMQAKLDQQNFSRIASRSKQFLAQLSARNKQQIPVEE